MAELLTAAQMRAVEQAAIAEGSVTGLELMERAGQGVVAAVFEEWPELAATSHRVVVLCGPGNNGGDGFVIARLLHGWGWKVEAFLYGEAEKLPPDARVNYDRWRALGPVAPLCDYEHKEGWRCDLLVDALFGTGLTRGLRALGDLFWNMEDMVDGFPVAPGHARGRPAVVAVDIPSGLCADSGREFPHEDRHQRFSAMAHLTVTFHRMKLGHVLDAGPLRSGKVVVADIALRGNETRGDQACVLTSSVGALSKEAGHKFTHGHALVLAGRSGKGGAARLAARGALRIGAGLVTVAPTPGALQENAAQLNAIMLEPVGDAEALSKLLEDARINALCLGPGLGVERAAALLPVALAAERKTVLDADALTALAADKTLFGTLHKDCVLTPHAGEFARLFPDIAEKLAEPASTGPAYSKVDAARAAAARAGCTVLFKGPDTVIADATGSAAINAAVYERAAPWLATAGSGDVLAGFITGLLARGFSPVSAAEAGAFLHVEAARGFGPGLIAEDLPEMLPKVFRDLGLSSDMSSKGEIPEWPKAHRAKDGPFILP